MFTTMSIVDPSESGGSPTGPEGPNGPEDAPEDAVVLTDRETDVMNVLWAIGSGTVAEVREELPDDLAYTTVLTVLRTLERKGYVDHESEGRAHRYRPVVVKDEAREGALDRVLRKLFGGSPELLVAHLLAERGLDDAQLERLRTLVEERLEERGEES